MSENKRSKLSFLSKVLVFVMILSVIFCTPVAAAANNTLSTLAPLNLRKTASTTAESLTLIPQNATVNLLSNSTNGWAKISYSSYTGYCSTDYLRPATNSTVKMTGKTTSELNVRSGKGTSYDVVAIIPNNTTVSVTDNSDEKWVKVSYSSKTGYVSRDYITILFTLTEDKGTDYSDLPLWYDQSVADNKINGSDVDSTKIVLNTYSLSLDINERFILTPVISGVDPISGNITFTSSNTSVATVSNAGLIIGKGKGSTNIIVTDPVTLDTVVCKVVVTGTVAPTQPPSTVEPSTAQPSTAQPSTAPPSTEPPTTAPPASDTLKLSETSVSLYVGNEHILKATSNSTVIWATSNSSVATVSGGLVVAKGEGTATITAKTSTKSVSCTVTVKKSTVSVGISHGSATVVAGKTFLANTPTSGVTWSSSDTSVATVKNGYILGVSAGKAIIKVSKTGGAATMVVTVSAAAPIRFAYTSPNCAVKNGTVTLVAITDNKRTSVKFDVTVGSTTKTVNATSKTADGSNYIWKATTSFSSAGTYNVKAYSKTSSSSSWSTCADAATTAFVTSTTDKNTTICAKRRASDEVIDLIAVYEGFVGSVYSDPLTGDPTLGYGRLVYSGQQFYNNLTKTEAYAYLVQTVNNDGYSSKVNSFLVDNGVKFNQQQFDALVCFVYNTGTGVLTNDSEIRSALLNCSSGTAGTTTYYINGSSVRIRKGPGTDYDIIKELSYGTNIKILEKTTSSWYYVQLDDGTKGYVITDYIASRTSSGSLDLNFVNKQNVIDAMCQYHHAGGCIYGLLYRRVDEMEVFFYGDYDRNYGNYKYNIKFTCSKDKDFHT